MERHGCGALVRCGGPLLLLHNGAPAAAGD